ncbi:hypothetical protein [Streptomyces sp. NPDC048644]|uniref:hypothetical protein n=1 Tax=Streptomyces sp. NPDC048644 TaxID=3365582 RepID=UPI00371A00CC
MSSPSTSGPRPSGDPPPFRWWYGTQGPPAGRRARYLAATLTGPPGDQRARIRIHQHAATPTGRREIYRALYTALSGRLAAAGRFEHTVLVAAGHRDVIDCLTELGFGIDQIKGIRPPDPPPVTARATRVRAARAEDLAELLCLTLELQKFHAQPPMLSPALIDTRVAWAHADLSCRGFLPEP